MAKSMILFYLVFFAVILYSCAYKPQSQTSKVPPGQAKKAFGSKSAKPFAPGQQKK
jgi:hypothetical protein